MDSNIYQILIYDKGDISNWVERERKNSKYDVGHYLTTRKKY
jgi:hypothetical protein